MSKRHEKMLFNYGTTILTDFRDGEIKPLIKTEYKEKPRRPRPSFEPVNYVHTMETWKKPLPFNETIKLRDILQTNPRDVQKPYHAYVDHEREEVQRTRPRLVMTPAVSMDDIEPEARNILTEAMYTSAMTSSCREALVPYCNVKSPLPDRPAVADPISLPKLKPPQVPKEWLMDSVKWDLRQLRSNVRPTREFWLMDENKPTKCIPCEESAVMTKQRKMAT